MALLSVHDKAGLVDFAKGLSELGIKLISSGGTAKALEEAGLEVTKVSAVTGSPEILDGRVKTLHPKIHGAILALREDEGHMQVLSDLGIVPIDIVVCNLYPFEATVAKGADMADAMENMDIGGPSMIRSAAKNHSHVLVIVSPSQYDTVLEMLRKDGDVPIEKRGELAREAILHTAAYDIAIHDFLTKNYRRAERFPQTIVHRYEKVHKCRYGENKHQEGAFYRAYGDDSGLLKAKKLHGKELSFNNYLDLNDALRIVEEFKEPTACVMKHANPCGVATRDQISLAYRIAFDADSKSAFGGVVGLNRAVDKATAKEMKGVFLEAIIAPGFDDDALELLRKKKDIRLMEIAPGSMDPEQPDIKKVAGGILFQTLDMQEVSLETMVPATEKLPTKDQLRDLLFAWKVVRHVKSNAIVLAKNMATVGIGAGQMSRVDSTEIAVMKSNGECKGSVLASDAFFPFRDAIDVAGKNGITAIAQPGGSIRDKEVIDAANEHGIAMVFTGIRAFRH
jgi:phosphoribosylaminoimidazolecarboxamide formyltransferase/IMP cyclohydrolase